MSAHVLDFRDRVVVVTGAGRGLGRAIAEAFAAAAAHVVLVDRDQDAAVTAAAAIRSGGAIAEALEVNVQDEAGIRQLFEDVTHRVAAPHVLVNNAGITIQKDALELSLEEWTRVQGVNLTGSFLCSRAFASVQPRGPRGASIVNVSSINGLVAPAFHPSSAYAAAKAGVAGLTRALAQEWGSRHIRVNAIAPTYIRTEMTAARLGDPAFADRIVERTPIGRLGEVDDIVTPVLFLASSGAGLITGHVLPVDGGWTIV